MRWLALLLVLAPALAAAEKDDPTDPPADKAKLVGEWSGKLTIDAQPGGKRFQGVWVQRDGATLPKPGELDRDRLLIDYRARELWRGFEGQRVLARGTCYLPVGQAIAATHFDIDRLKFTGAAPTAASLLEIGPRVLLDGELVAHAGGKGLVFRAGSITYAIAGTSQDTPLVPGRVKIGGRTVVVNPKVVSTTAKDHLWILELHPHSYVPDRSMQNSYYLCK
jgi:hypothetical protein